MRLTTGHKSTSVHSIPGYKSLGMFSNHRIVGVTMAQPMEVRSKMEESALTPWSPVLDLQEALLLHSQIGCIYVGK